MVVGGGLYGRLGETWSWNIENVAKVVSVVDFGLASLLSCL